MGRGKVGKLYTIIERSVETVYSTKIMLSYQDIINAQEQENRNPVKVSISMTTYNHEAYIEEAIRSVLAQRTTFAYQLVIGEDCSTDNTRSIVEKYAAKYPDRIVPIYHEKNVGLNRNERSVLEKCTGKYFAFLEGDDYWSDTYKLQKGYDFLEKHPEYIGFVHNHDILHNGVMEERKQRIQLGVYGRKNALNNDYLGHTSAFLFRNYFKYMEKDDFNKYCECSVLSHGKMSIVTGILGDIYRSPETMSVYRLNDAFGSSWSAGQYAKNENLFYFTGRTEMVYFIRDFFGLEMNTDAQIQQIVANAFKDMIKKPNAENRKQFRTIAESGYYSKGKLLGIILRHLI